MKTVTITFTVDEAKELASLLLKKSGMIGWQGTQDNFNGRPVSKERQAALDDSYQFWHGLSKKVSTAFGYEAWAQPSSYASEEMDLKVLKAVIELPLSPLD